MMRMQMSNGDESCEHKQKIHGPLLVRFALGGMALNQDQL
jgi:hypothetical protein